MDSQEKTGESSTIIKENMESEGDFANEGDMPLILKERFKVRDSREEETEYEMTIVRFVNSWQVFLTYTSNVGTWVCSSADMSNLDIYSTRVLLGDRTKEYLQLYARNGIKILCDCLKEKKKINRYSPTDEMILIMALDIKDDDRTAFIEIMDNLKNSFCKLI